MQTARREGAPRSVTRVGAPRSVSLTVAARGGRGAMTVRLTGQLPARRYLRPCALCEIDRSGQAPRPRVCPRLHVEGTKGKLLLHGPCSHMMLQYKLHLLLLLNYF